MNDNQKPVKLTRIIIEIIMVTDPEDCYILTEALLRMKSGKMISKLKYFL